MTEYARPPMRDRLIASLTASDARQRGARADRILWLAANQYASPAYFGPIEELALHREAQHCYISGHFIGTVFAALAFVEQTMLAELIELGHTADTRMYISEAVKLAKRHAVFAEGLLSRAAELAERRNGYAHLRDGEHQYSFARRFMEEKRHPDLIRQQDAQDALKLMDDFFRATLK